MSQWKERGMHWFCDWHWNSSWRQGDPVNQTTKALIPLKPIEGNNCTPGGLGLQESSSELSPQSSSPSQRQFLRTHRLLAHWYSLGWQPDRLHRISSDWSEQSKSPSQTAFFGMHSPFMQVASLTPQAVGGRVVGSATIVVVAYKQRVIC